MLPGQFFVNTFSIDEYAVALPDRSPVALVLPVDRRLEMVYWLYWRAYELTLPRDGFVELFGEELESVFGGLMKLLVRTGMAQLDRNVYQLSDEAAYWIHRVQNEYALNYINRLWGRCRSEAWPSRVRL
jgi:hypothetical protein